MREKLTKAQREALAIVAKRDWPAGEPRLRWMNKATAAVLLRRGLIAERPGTEESAWGASCIVDLTDAGRAALTKGGSND